ncbi:MAG: hypothetical protein IKR73_02775 [Oscillospiraceae bacterium]|nr:hypothetical protein [Oscillospiraceae bacterium]
MTKRIITAVLCILLTGCSLSDITDKIKGKEEEQTQMTAETAAPNNYVKKDTDIEVTGEVTSITGNEVTLALGEASGESSEDAGEDSERPSFGDGEMPSFGDGEMPSFGDGERPSFGDGERPSFGDGERPSFGDGERPSFGDGSGNGRSRRKKSIEKTGEEATYIIPVGMTIDGLSGRKQDYSGITVGTVLTLTVNSDGVVCAARC